MSDSKHSSRDDLMNELRTIAVLEPRIVPFGDVRELMRERARLNHECGRLEEQRETLNVENAKLNAENRDLLEKWSARGGRIPDLEEQLDTVTRERDELAQRLAGYKVDRL